MFTELLPHGLPCSHHWWSSGDKTGEVPAFLELRGYVRAGEKAQYTRKTAAKVSVACSWALKTIISVMLPGLQGA